MDHDDFLAKEMVMSQENIKRKKSALDFNAIEAEPFIKALKDRGRRKPELGAGMMVVGRAPTGATDEQLLFVRLKSHHFCIFLDIRYSAMSVRNWVYI